VAGAGAGGDPRANVLDQPQGRLGGQGVQVGCLGRFQLGGTARFERQPSQAV